MTFRQLSKNPLVSYQQAVLKVNPQIDFNKLEDILDVVSQTQKEIERRTKEENSLTYKTFGFAKDFFSEMFFGNKPGELSQLFRNQQHNIGILTNYAMSVATNYRNEFERLDAYNDSIIDRIDNSDSKIKSLDSKINSDSIIYKRLLDKPKTAELKKKLKRSFLSVDDNVHKKNLLTKLQLYSQREEGFTYQVGVNLRDIAKHLESISQHSMLVGRTLNHTLNAYFMIPATKRIYSKLKESVQSMGSQIITMHNHMEECQNYLSIESGDIYE